jgi:hypothetical protein
MFRDTIRTQVVCCNLSTTTAHVKGRRRVGFEEGEGRGVGVYFGSEESLVGAFVYTSDIPVSRSGNLRMIYADFSSLQLAFFFLLHMSCVSRLVLLRACLTFSFSTVFFSFFFAVPRGRRNHVCLRCQSPGHSVAA